MTKNCDYDATGAMLQHVLSKGDHNFQLLPKDADWKSKGILRYVEQTDFFDEQHADNGLDIYGFAYQPTACYANADTKCKIHVVFHECAQNNIFILDHFVRYS